MDPNACSAALDSAMRDRNWSEAAHLADALADWLGAGGFPAGEEHWTRYMAPRNLRDMARSFRCWALSESDLLTSADVDNLHDALLRELEM